MRSVRLEADRCSFVPDLLFGLHSSVSAGLRVSLRLVGKAQKACVENGENPQLLSCSFTTGVELDVQRLESLEEGCNSGIRSLARHARAKYLPSWRRSLVRRAQRLRRVVGADVPEDAFALLVRIWVWLFAADPGGHRRGFGTFRFPHSTCLDFGRSSYARPDVRLVLASGLANCRDTTDLLSSLLRSGRGRTIGRLRSGSHISSDDVKRWEREQRLSLLELLGENIRGLNLWRRSKELLGLGEERLSNCTVDVRTPPFLIPERVKDAKRCRSNLEGEPRSRTRFGFDKGSCGPEELFYFSLFAWPRVQCRQYSKPVHLNFPPYFVF